jgi:hypothetical protein
MRASRVRPLRRPVRDQLDDILQRTLVPFEVVRAATELERSVLGAETVEGLPGVRAVSSLHIDNRERNVQRVATPKLPKFAVWGSPE